MEFQIYHQHRYADETFGMTETGLPIKNQTSTKVNSVLTHVGSCLEIMSNIFNVICINIVDREDGCKFFAALPIDRQSQDLFPFYLALVTYLTK